jgi:hypothetical protein
MSYSQISDDSDRGRRIRVPNGDEYDGESSSSLRPTRSTSAAHTTSSDALSEPLNANGDEEAGENSDPFYVFRADLYRKLELVDESLMEYQRVVHQTVSKILHCILIGR